MVKIVKVFYDDWELTQYCHVRNISTSLQAPRSNVFQVHPDRDGAYFKQTTLGQVVVEIKLSIRSRTLQNLDLLNKILNSRQPKKLYIDDRPDRYLMAVLANDTTSVSGRYYASTFTLKFISPDSFWRSTEGVKTLYSDEEGRFVVSDLGTADTPLDLEVNFTSDCGHLAIVTPNAHISLGNPEEVDAVKLPSSEFAMNEEMSDMSGWTKLGTADLEKYMLRPVDFAATGETRTDEYGLTMRPSWPVINGKWNGVFYKKDFDAGVAGIEASNFKHKSRIDFEDMYGNNLAAGIMYFMIYDTDDRPIMGAQIKDANADKTELDVWMLMGNPDKNHPDIVNLVKRGTLSKLRGWLALEKMGDNFSWMIHNENGTTSTPSPTIPPPLKVGDIVHLKQSATTIYDWEGRALRLSNTIKGIQLKVTAIRNSPKGRYQLSNVKGGWVEGFFEADAIQETAPIPSSPISTGPERISHSTKNPGLAQTRAKGIAIGMFKFMDSPILSVGSINSSVIQRIHTDKEYDIPNTFMPGDKLTIKDGEILLNGTVFNGQVSYDSRPLYVEGGVPSQVALLPSSWATMPSAKIQYEKRWL